jgi:predicted HTH domain antitoxin
MLVSVEGVYSDGKVEIKERPPAEATSRVIVTFIDSGDQADSQFREELRRRALRAMEEGLDLGGPPYPSRDVLSDRTRGGRQPDELTTAACVHLYSQGLISQGRAAELAGLARAEFLDELFRRRVPACQVTLEELIEEIERG